MRGQEPHLLHAFLAVVLLLSRLVPLLGNGRAGVVQPGAGGSLALQTPPAPLALAGRQCTAFPCHSLNMGKVGKPKAFRALPGSTLLLSNNGQHTCSCTGNWGLRVSKHVSPEIRDGCGAVLREVADSRVAPDLSAGSIISLRCLQ